MRLLAFLVLAWAGSALAQQSFYKGKNIRIIVGASAGGGYDTYSRAIARHMGIHIPGNPSIVVDNMPGAGFLISANYMYKVAKPDGLTIGHFIGGLFLQQFLGSRPGIEFDSRKFEFIGVPAQAYGGALFDSAVRRQHDADWFAGVRRHRSACGHRVGRSVTCRIQRRRNHQLGWWRTRERPRRPHLSRLGRRWFR